MSKMGCHLVLLLSVLLVPFSTCQVYSKQDQGLTDIPDDIPVNVRNINLQSNQLETIPDSAFGDFSQLSYLDLSKNKITYVSDSAFNGTVISSLRLNNNLLSTLPNLDSVGSTLTHFYADHNRLQVLSESTFHQVLSLKYLHINHNQISSLEEGLLRKSASSLTLLELGYNRIEDISHTFFANMSSLSQLTLQSNRLKSFPDFSLLPDDNGLSSLYINNNDFGNLAENSLYKLTKLRIIAMSFNQLNQLPNFQRQRSSLKTLYLSGNDISDPPSDAFEGMSLDLLNLERNGLQELPNVVPMRSTLRTLYLSNNDFGPIACHTMLEFLQTMTNLTSFTLAYVGLETFPDLRLVGRKLQRVKIQNPNTMVCDCGISWLKEPSAIQVASSLDVQNNSLVCGSPAILNGRTWQSITMNLLCPDLAAYDVSSCHFNGKELDQSSSTSQAFITSSFYDSTVTRATSKTPESTSEFVSTSISDDGKSSATEGISTTKYDMTTTINIIANDGGVGGSQTAAIIAGTLSGLLVITVLVIIALVLRIRRAQSKPQATEPTVTLKQEDPSYQSLKAQADGAPDSHVPPQAPYAYLNIEAPQSEPKQPHTTPPTPDNTYIRMDGAKKASMDDYDDAKSGGYTDVYEEINHGSESVYDEI